MPPDKPPKVTKFPETPEARMKRILRERVAKAESSERQPKFREFSYEGFVVQQNLETGRVTVTGPAGVSEHDKRPEQIDAKVINTHAGQESIENNKINRDHLKTVQLMYDAGLMDLPKAEE